MVCVASLTRYVEDRTLRGLLFVATHCFETLPAHRWSGIRIHDKAISLHPPSRPARPRLIPYV